jgi:hypothetical protein
MFALFSNQLRRILAISLISITLYFSFAFSSHSDRASAEVLKRDTVGISEDKVLNEAEYESAKISRNQKQAQRSKQAEQEAKQDLKNKSVSDKLSLDEIVPPAVEDALDLD